MYAKRLFGYCDGACKHQADAVRRMAGIGVWFGHEHPHNVSEPLLGDKQTSARAELAAIVRTIEQAEKIDGVLPLTIFSDSSYAVLELNRILHPRDLKVIKGERLNGDLLKALARLVLVRKAPVRVVKVKGHSTDAGNRAADQLASAAAERAYKRRHTPAPAVY